MFADSWVSSTAEHLKFWCPAGLPTNSCEWRQLLKSWSRSVWDSESEDLLERCQSHPRLAHYFPVQLHLGNPSCVNEFLHNASVAVETAHCVGRLFSGGQGLRAADPRVTPIATVDNCCVFCLELGVRVAETLAHVMFNCPSYQHIRDGSELFLLIRSRDPVLFQHHRAFVSWNCLRRVRELVLNTLTYRRSISGGVASKCKSYLHQAAQELWNHCESDSESDS